MAAGQTEISFLRNNLNARLAGGEGRKLCADLEDMAARGEFRRAGQQVLATRP
jgi:hypothetical protein